MELQIWIIPVGEDFRLGKCFYFILSLLKKKRGFFCSYIICRYCSKATAPLSSIQRFGKHKEQEVTLILAHLLGLQGVKDL